MAVVTDLGKPDRLEGEPERVTDADRVNATQRIHDADRVNNDLSAMLPGDNPYDQAVRDGTIDYPTAKIREEVLRVREVTERERISTERERISLEKDRLSLQEARGELIRRDENISRLRELATAFNELLRLTISEATLSVPVVQRDEFQAKITAQAGAAMFALSECVSKKLNHEQVASEMLRAFTKEA